MRQRGDVVIPSAAACERRISDDLLYDDTGRKTMNGPGSAGIVRTRDSVSCWISAAVARRGSIAMSSASQGGAGDGSLRATALASRSIFSGADAPKYVG